MTIKHELRERMRAIDYVMMSNQSILIITDEININIFLMLNKSSSAIKERDKTIHRYITCTFIYQERQERTEMETDLGLWHGI